MVDKIREGLGLLGKLVSWKDLVHGFSSAEDIEEEEHSTSAKRETEPMQVYWDKEKKLYNQNQDSIDLFLNDDHGLSRIPDVTEEPVKESQYNFYDIPTITHLLDDLNNERSLGVPEPPKVDTGISSSGRDAGVVAGIVVAVISGVIILAALIAVVLYRHYVHRNVTSMNFDNPVYRKTTEDQFALEKNGYAPGNKLYLSTVGEEAQEPLNTPGTNEFV